MSYCFHYTAAFLVYPVERHQLRNIKTSNEVFEATIEGDLKHLP